MILSLTFDPKTMMLSMVLTAGSVVSSCPLTKTSMTGVVEVEVLGTWTTSMVLITCLPTFGSGVTSSTVPTTRTAPVYTGGSGPTLIVTVPGVLVVVAGVDCGPVAVTW